MLPDRFDLEITAADGSRQRPVMIHRALFGSVERFIACIGRALRRRLPAVAGAGASHRHSGGERVQRLSRRGGRSARAEGVRVEVDTSDDRMQKKIRNAERVKVPYVLIAGAEDAVADAVSFRYRDRRQKNGIPIDAAISEITGDIEARRQV